MSPVEHRLYEGHLGHRRVAPMLHEFDVPLALVMVVLDDATSLANRHRLWSVHRRAPIELRASDYHDGSATTLAELAAAVRAEVGAALSIAATGPVAMLASPRVWGWCFNPLTVFYVWDGAQLVAAVLEVTNTPWGERGRHVLDLRSGFGPWTREVVKDLHVSPFMPMDLVYRIVLSAPGEELSVRFECRKDGTEVFRADLELAGRPLDRAAMTRYLVRDRLVPQRVVVGIYRQAWRLWRKGAPFHPHPRRRRTSDEPERPNLERL